METMSVKGHTGTVEFDGNFVTIKRTGGLARMSVGKGEKRIPLRSITAVQLKPAGAMVNGFLAFSLAGGNEKQSRFGSQTTSAARDENSVIFTKKQQPAFEAIRSAIENAMIGAPPGGPSILLPPPPQPPAPPSVPAGWYPDQSAPGLQRYWDGSHWTDHTAPL